MKIKNILRVLKVALLVSPIGLAWSTDWHNIAGGAYDDPNNWNPLGVPLSTEGVLFNLGASSFSPYTVTFPASYTQTDFDIYNDAVIFNLGGNTFSSGGTSYLANTATDNAYLIIQNGTLNKTSSLSVGHFGNAQLYISNNAALTTSALTNIGSLSGSYGAVTLTGSNSSWTSTSAIYVGRYSNGDLNINGGADVSNTAGYVGRYAGSIGNVVVNGSGSTWTNNSILYMGREGSGTMFVEFGGVVNSTYGYLGYATGSEGNITVDGAGSAWNAGNSIFLGGTASVTGGTGTLTVRNGGAVNVNGLTKLWAGGTLNMEGGSFNTNSLDASEGTMNFTDGTLTVDGGTFTPATGDFIIDGDIATDNPALDLVNGTTGTISGNLTIGNNQQASLSIQNGASLTNSFGYIGNGTGSNGTVTVDGTGSNWNNSSPLVIGNQGSGTLTIRNGGTVVSDIFLDGAILYNNSKVGSSAGSIGMVMVDGVGSSWTNVGSLSVGAGGNGTLDIINSGTVSSHGGYLGLNGSSGTVTVDGTGSIWTVSANSPNSNSMVVGGSGTGTLNITNGGTVSNEGRSNIGSSSGGSGTVTVDGVGSSLSNGGIMRVGEQGTGSLLIQNGGSVSTETMTIADGAGSSGEVIVDGAGSRLDITGFGFVGIGSSGNASLFIRNGGSVVTSPDGSTLMGASVDGSGSAIIDGIGSTWISQGLSIGSNATSEVIIRNGGEITSTFARIYHSSTVTVEGANSRWLISGDFAGLSIGADVNSPVSKMVILDGGAVSNSRDGRIGTSNDHGTVVVDGVGSNWTSGGSVTLGSATGSGFLQILAGASVDITNTLDVQAGSTVELTAGTLNAGGLVSEGTFNFNSGSLNIGNDFNVGFAGPLGDNLTLSAIHQLSVGGTTTIDQFSVLTLDGGTFSTGNITNSGILDIRRGTFNLTNADLVIAAGGMFDNTLELNTGTTMNVTNNVTVAADGVLSLNSGSLTASTVTNNGSIDLNSPSSTLGGGTLTNNGVVTGDGRITAQLTNATAGEVRVIGGDMLTHTGAGNTNQGNINILGGTVEFTQDLANNTGGIISGSGNLIVSGGLTNQGTMALSVGATTTGIIGDVNNTGTIIVSGNGTASFYDDVVHNGTEIRVSDGSSAVFFGSVSGVGSYTGTGSLFFEGDLNPGNSPGLVDVEGDLTLGIGSHTLMEIGGLVRGDEYDAFDIGGDLLLNGELEVGLYDLGSGLFDPQLGDSFDLFMAETISGDFDLLTLALLGEGLGWQLDYLTDEIGTMDIARLSVVTSTVPVPAAVWLFASGLLGLIGIARRRRCH